MWTAKPLTSCWSLSTALVMCSWSGCWYFCTMVSFRSALSSSFSCTEISKATIQEIGNADVLYTIDFIFSVEQMWEVRCCWMSIVWYRGRKSGSGLPYGRKENTAGRIQRGGREGLGTWGGKNTQKKACRHTDTFKKSRCIACIHNSFHKKGSAVRICVNYMAC